MTNNVTNECIEYAGMDGAVTRAEWVWGAWAWRDVRRRRRGFLNPKP